MATKIGDWSAAKVNGEKLFYDDGAAFDEDIHALTKTLLEPLANSDQTKDDNSDPDLIDNSKITFMLNQLGAKSVILGAQDHRDPGKINGNFAVTSSELPEFVVDMASGSAHEQIEKVCSVAANVPIIINNGANGYSIRLPKPTAHSANAGSEPQEEPASAASDSDPAEVIAPTATEKNGAAE